jgi:2-deoxy-D-gluconate 3-dehydrogenase
VEVAADVTSRSDIHRVIDLMVGQLGRIDILVNSAGTIKRVPSLEMADEDWIGRNPGSSYFPGFRQCQLCNR